MYVWQQAEGKRHGRESGCRSELPEGRAFRSLCGEDLTVSAQDVHSATTPGWLDPVCGSCDSIMRRALGVPVRNTLVGA